MVPPWLAAVIAEKFLEAGVSLAQNLRKNLPPSEDQIKSYLHSTARQLETIPYKIPCPARNAGLAVETFFLWPRLDVARQRKENEEEFKRETFPERILAQDLLFSPPAGKNLFAVEGPAGVGKTTLARSLVYWAATETLKLLDGEPEAARLARPLLPIYLDAGDLVKIAEGKTQSGVPWEKIPGNWGLLVVVDGLDELELSLRTRALERMKGPWLQRTDENLAFLFGRPGSARSLSWESREERILALELRPWGLEEVKSYLEKWTREGSIQEADATRILQHVRENFELPILPLLVYLLVCDFLQTGEVERLPRSRRELYDSYLIQAIFREAEQATQVYPGTPRPLSGDEVFALGCLELAIKEDPQLEAEVHRPRPSCEARQLYKLERRWKALCPGAQVSWDDLLRLWERRKFCWLGHKSFHDYLAAKALARIYEGRPEDFWREWIHPKVFDPYWTQTLVFATALLPDADRQRILTGLLALQDCDPISQATHRHHAIVAEILAESESAEEEILNAWLAQKPAPKYLARVHRVAVERTRSLLEQLAQDQHLLVRIRAAEALIQLGYHDMAIPTLEHLIQYQDPWVGLWATETFTQLGDKALPSLQRLAQQQDHGVRLRVAWTLMQLGYRDKALPILEQLAQDQDPAVRLTAVEPLGQLGYGEKVLPAVEHLVRNQDSRTRLVAAEALVYLGYREKALPVLEELAKLEDPLVRLRAAEALAQLGLRKKAVPILEQLLQGQGEWIRLKAGEALAQLGNSALHALQRLAKLEDPLVRLRAAEAFAQLGFHKKAVPILEELARDQDFWITLKATEALAQLGDVALPTLVQLSQNQDPKVRLGAARAIVRLRYSQMSLSILENLAQHQKPEVRRVATDTLARLGHPPLGCEELPRSEKGGVKA